MNITMQGKYQTRDGRAVRILCVDGPTEDQPVVGIVEGETDIDQWTSEGVSFPWPCSDKTTVKKYWQFDLIPVPTRHQAWGVMRMRSRPNDIMNIADSAVFETKQEAAHYMTSVCLNGAFLVLVTWES